MPLPVLWPELSATQANDLATWLWGKAYQRTVELIQNSPTVKDHLGEVIEVRPVASKNEINTKNNNSVAIFTVQLMSEDKSAVAHMHSKVFTTEHFFDATMYMMSIDYIPLITGIIILADESDKNNIIGIDGPSPPEEPDLDIGAVLRLRQIIAASYCKIIGR